MRMLIGGDKKEGPLQRRARFRAPDTYVVSKCQAREVSVLIGQILTAGLTGAPDLNSAIKQIVDLFGAFDVALANLTHCEAAVLTVAHSFKRPERTPRWLWRCNDLLARWSSPNNDLRMEEDEFFQELLALVQRGIEVEVPHDGQRDAPLLTATDNPGILYERKVCIRPMILLVNW
ncbi:hypothetical protein [Burkholderia sp. LMG 21824]|uniref:hypothetical protein n=1 Tax=Burkholderia sp. LMG 21824 TaxID=3158172 RepID=UPI003C2C5160